MTTKNLLSIAELAREVNVSPTAVRKWLAEGAIERPAATGGSAKLFTAAQVRRIKKVAERRRRKRRAAKRESA